MFFSHELKKNKIFLCLTIKTENLDLIKFIFPLCLKVDEGVNNFYLAYHAINDIIYFTFRDRKHNMKSSCANRMCANTSTTVKSPPPLKQREKAVRKNSHLTTMDADPTYTNKSHSKHSKYTSSSKLTKSMLFRTFSKANFRENQDRSKQEKDTEIECLANVL